MEGNRPRIEECTTTHFNGCALRRATPRASALRACTATHVRLRALQHNLHLQPRWQLVSQVAARGCVLPPLLARVGPSARLRGAACAERQVPGCYALSVTDKIAEDVMEQLEE